MILDVEAALNSIVGHVATLEHAAGAGRIFELFVMTSVARGLRDAGFTVWLQRSDGTQILPTDSDRRFIQRGGAPTGVPAASSGPGNGSVIGFRGGAGGGWEIWNGIQFGGRSGARHEIDIAVVPASVGAALRVHGGVPVGRPRVAIECKDVEKSGSLDEMRAFMGRLYDVTLLQAHHVHLGYPQSRAIHPGSPNLPMHHAIMTYWQENRRTKNILARRTTFTHGTAPLARYHAIEPHQSISAGSATTGALVASVVDWASRYA
ncbi:hypothetical protein BH10PSE12_BH10PSE12_07810 [soil metagenome]